MQSVNGSLPQRGCYTLVIDLPRDKTIRVGKLKSTRFPKGTYYYTGSAMNSLSARVSRHLRKKNKKCHWHIDYLLTQPETKIKTVLTYPFQIHKECTLNQRISRFHGAKILVKGFGSSDCTLGCGSHLIYFPSEHSPRRVLKLLNTTNQSKKSKEGKSVL